MIAQNGMRYDQIPDEDGVYAGSYFEGGFERDDVMQVEIADKALDLTVELDNGVNP